MTKIFHMRDVKRRDALNLGFSHLLLLGSSLRGGWSYDVLQVLGVFELALTSIATALFLSRRELSDRVMDEIVSLALYCILGFVTLTGYAAAAGDYPLELLIGHIQHIGPKALYWAAIYIGVSMGLSLWSALRSDDPRTVWMKSRYCMTGGICIVMVTTAVFAGVCGKSFTAALGAAGIPANLDAVLITVWVSSRYFFSLVFSTNDAAEWKSLSSVVYDGKVDQSENATVTATEVDTGGITAAGKIQPSRNDLPG
jgi:hypothetical protein